MLRGFMWITFLLVMAGFAACKKQPAVNEEITTKSSQTAGSQPEHITVQHILISFDGSPIGKTVGRSLQESEALAKEVLEKAKQPDAKFDELVKAYTDDRAPGVYSMSNFGVTPEGDEFPRDRMVPAFGDVGFQLEVGQVAVAPYDKEKSPYGFHIIKRLR